MTRTDCLATLLRLIARADRGELGEAQAAIIQFALASEDPAKRAGDMAALQADLADAAGARRLDGTQAAYAAVVGAMIDRTRDAVTRPGAPTPS